MLKYIILPMLLIISCLTLHAQHFSPAEQELYDLILKYRKSKSLPPIPASPSLTAVAQTHARDLHENRPDTGKCNMHSWSDKGNWSAVCYTKDHASASGVWQKPAELTTYKGTGYEIAYRVWGYPGIQVSPLKALQGWQSSIGHNNMIINRDKWANIKWRAIGVGIYMGYAVVWFGEEADEFIVSGY